MIFPSFFVYCSNIYAEKCLCVVYIELGDTRAASVGYCERESVSVLIL